MLKRVRIGSLRVGLSIARVTNVEGVNSLLDNGKHVLMWDFDNTTLPEVNHALYRVQLRYKLSSIFIFETKPETNYIAYCFTALPFLEACSIISATHGVDNYFFRFGVYRGKFTLRVSPKNDRHIKYAMILPSELPSNCWMQDLKRFVKYETLKSG